MPSVKLSWAQVLAWRTERQFLTKRAPRAQMLEVVSRVCGLQAQVLSAAMLQLWARVEGITADDVAAALWQQRSLVKLWMMRGTLHLMLASDVPLYVAATQTTRYIGNDNGWRAYYGATASDVAEAARASLSDQPITRTQLIEAMSTQLNSETARQHMLSGWGTILKPASYQGYLCFGPSQGTNVTFVHTQQWIGEWQEQAGDAASAEITRRFLSVYGPSTAKDFGLWWIGGASNISKQMLKQISDELVEVNVEGWKGLALAKDVDDLQQAKATSVRLLPNFDPYTLTATRGISSILPQQYKSRVYRVAGWISPVLLVNGAIVGVWQYTRQRERIAVRIESFGKLSSAVKASAEAEAERLGSFFGSKVDLSYGPLAEVSNPKSNDAG